MVKRQVPRRAEQIGTRVTQRRLLIGHATDADISFLNNVLDLFRRHNPHHQLRDLPA